MKNKIPEQRLFEAIGNVSDELADMSAPYRSRSALKTEVKNLVEIETEYREPRFARLKTVIGSLAAAAVIIAGGVLLVKSLPELSTNPGFNAGTSSAAPGTTASAASVTPVQTTSSDYVEPVTDMDTLRELYPFYFDLTPYGILKIWVKQADDRPEWRFALQEQAVFSEKVYLPNGEGLPYLPPESMRVILSSYPSETEFEFDLTQRDEPVTGETLRLIYDSLGLSVYKPEEIPYTADTDAEATFETEQIYRNTDNSGIGTFNTALVLQDGSALRAVKFFSKNTIIDKLSSLWEDMTHYHFPLKYDVFSAYDVFSEVIDEDGTITAEGLGKYFREVTAYDLTTNVHNDSVKVYQLNDHQFISVFSSITVSEIWLYETDYKLTALRRALEMLWQAKADYPDMTVFAVQDDLNGDRLSVVMNTWEEADALSAFISARSTEMNEVNVLEFADFVNERASWSPSVELYYEYDHDGVYRSYNGPDINDGYMRTESGGVLKRTVLRENPSTLEVIADELEEEGDPYAAKMLREQGIAYAEQSPVVPFAELFDYRALPPKGLDSSFYAVDRSEVIEVTADGQYRLWLPDNSSLAQAVYTVNKLRKAYEYDNLPHIPVVQVIRHLDSDDFSYESYEVVVVCDEINRDKILVLADISENEVTFSDKRLA